MEQFVIKNQYDFYAIPNNFNGVLVIDGGNEDNPIVIDQNYYLDLLVINHAYVVLKISISLKVQNYATVIARSQSFIEASGNAMVIARDKTKVSAHGHCTVIGKDYSQISAFGFCDLRLWDRAVGRVRGNVSVMGFDNSRAYLQQDCKYYRYSPLARAYFKHRAREINPIGTRMY